MSFDLSIQEKKNDVEIAKEK